MFLCLEGNVRNAFQTEERIREIGKVEVRHACDLTYVENGIKRGDRFKCILIGDFGGGHIEAIGAIEKLLAKYQPDAPRPEFAIASSEQALQKSLQKVCRRRGIKFIDRCKVSAADEIFEFATGKSLRSHESSVLASNVPPPLR